MIFSSLRWPIALVSLLLILACLGTVEWVIFAEVKATYLRSVEDNLRLNCRTIANLMGRHMDQVALTASERRIITDEMNRQSLAMSGRLCIVNWRGEVLEDSAGLRGQNIRHRPEVMTALHGKEDSTVRGLDGAVQPLEDAWESVSDPTMFVAVPMYAKGKVTGVIYGTRSLADLQLTLLNLRERLYEVALVTVTLAILSSILLAGWLTAPLRRLRDSARRFGEGHLQERSNIRGQDEVGQLAQTFNTMATNIETQHQALLRFVSDASHELKTPVTTLRASLEALEAGADQQPELRERFYQFLHRDLDRIERLVHDLLELHKLDRAAVRVDLESVAMADLRDGLADEYPEVTWEHAPDLTLRADRHRLRQVLTNLLDNARRATADQPDRQIRVLASPGRLTVTDNGVGLDPQDCERIFDRFYRVDSARTREDGGCGLGLSIVRGLLQAMNATIRVTSEGPGKGAQFRIDWH